MRLKDYIFKKRHAYKTALLSEHGRVVMADLYKSCHMSRTSFKIAQNGLADPLATAFAEGKRSVFLEIQEVLKLTDEQINAIERDVKNDTDSRNRASSAE